MKIETMNNGGGEFIVILQAEQFFLALVTDALLSDILDKYLYSI